MSPAEIGADSLGTSWKNPKRDLRRTRGRLRPRRIERPALEGKGGHGTAEPSLPTSRCIRTPGVRSSERRRVRVRRCNWHGKHILDRIRVARQLLAGSGLAVHGSFIAMPSLSGTLTGVRCAPCAGSSIDGPCPARGHVNLLTVAFIADGAGPAPAGNGHMWRCATHRCRNCNERAADARGAPTAAAPRLLHSAPSAPLADRGRSPEFDSPAGTASSAGPEAQESPAAKSENPRRRP